MPNDPTPLQTVIEATTGTTEPSKTNSGKLKNQWGRSRLEGRKPQVVEQAMKVFAMSGSFRLAAKATGLTHGTVKELVTRNPMGYAAAKNVVAAQALNLSSAAYERAANKLSNLDDPYRLTLIGKIAGQGHLEMTGMMQNGITVQVGIMSEVGTKLDLLRSQIERERTTTGSVQPPNSVDTTKQS